MHSGSHSLLFQKIFLGLLLLSLTPYICLSFFAHPVADDYHYAFLGSSPDFWSAWLHEYFFWNGRYSSNVLLLINPITFGSLKIYQAVPVILIGLSVASVYFFIRSATNRAISALTCINAALLIVLLELCLMPSLAEGFYWYTGSVTYQAGIIMSVFYLGMLCRYFYCDFFLSRPIHFFLILAVLIVAIGFNEVQMLLLVSFHLLIIIPFIIQKKKIDSVWWVLSAVSVVAASVMFFAPGNDVRSSWFAENHNLLRSLTYSLLQIIRFGTDWVSNLPTILSLMLSAVFVLGLKSEFDFTALLKKIKLKYFFLLSFSIIFICVFPAYWNTNILGQHRTVNVACFFFVLSILLAGIRSAEYIPANIKEAFVKNNKWGAVIGLSIILFAGTTKNGQAAMLDLFYGKAAMYDTQMNGRWEVLNLNKGGKNIIHLDFLNSRPKTLFVLDLSEDSTYWINSVQAKYFGVAAIDCK